LEQKEAFTLINNFTRKFRLKWKFDGNSKPVLIIKKEGIKGEALRIFERILLE
jgi:hypothetical protein